MEESGHDVDNALIVWITSGVIHKNGPDFWGFLCGEPDLCVDWHSFATYERWISG